MELERDPSRDDSTAQAPRRARRVLHVLWALDIGGAERAVFQLVREQRRQGVGADVLVGSHAGPYGERVRAVGATVHELGQRHALDVLRARPAAALFAAYDVVHVHVPEPLLVALAARRSRTWRAVYTHRGGIRDHAFAKRVRHAVVGRALRNRFDALSANTLQSARAAAALYRIPIARIPITYNGIDVALLAPARPLADVLGELPDAARTAVRLGTAANLRAWKRVDRLLRLVASLPGERIHAVILGDGPHRPELERLSRSLGVEDRVTFAGRREHIGDYLQAIDVFVLPSGPEEAFGNAVVEAMGVGLPVCVFADGGGLVEHVTDGETGFVVADERELVDRVRELVHDAGLRKRLGSAAQAAVRSRYAVAAMVHRYDELYGQARDE
jgi:glycosyltransferase involved in cell wall biosynthesis